MVPCGCRPTAMAAMTARPPAACVGDLSPYLIRAGLPPACVRPRPDSCELVETAALAAAARRARSPGGCRHASVRLEWRAMVAAMALTALAIVGPCTLPSQQKKATHRQCGGPRCSFQFCVHNRSPCSVPPLQGLADIPSTLYQRQAGSERLRIPSDLYSRLFRRNRAKQ